MSSYCTNGTCLYAVVMLFMSLYVLTKFHLAMSIEVQSAVENNFRWALSLRHAALEGKHITPKHRSIHHFNYNNRGKMVKWEDAVVSTDTLFDCAVESFYFWDMFIAGCNVELGMEVSKVATHQFKLIVGKDDGNSKTTSHVCSNESLEVLDDMGIFHAVQFTS